MKRTLLDRLASEGSPTRTLVSKVWRRYAMRNISANDNHAGLDTLYALPDPWGMSTEREQSRFRQTNQVIDSLAGRVDTLLELGSGEGHQSEHLARVCRQLDGLEISERAVARARERVPHCRFGVGDLAALPWQKPPGDRYDLVVACEVLYYFSDIEQTIEHMSRLGRACFVTFFAPSARRVAQHLEGLPGMQRGWIFHDPYAWLWAYWEPDAASSHDARKT